MSWITPKVKDKNVKSIVFCGKELFNFVLIECIHHWRNFSGLVSCSKLLFELAKRRKRNLQATYDWSIFPLNLKKFWFQNVVSWNHFHCGKVFLNQSFFKSNFLNAWLTHISKKYFSPRTLLFGNIKSKFMDFIS